MRALALPLLFLSVVPLLSIAQPPQEATTTDFSSLPISHLITLAQTYLSNGKTSSALQVYDHVLTRDPTDFTTLFQRATVRFGSNHYEKAKEGFQEVLKVREYEPARLALGKIYLKLGQYENARKELDLVLKSKLSTVSDSKEAKQLRSQVVEAESQVLTAKKALSTRNFERCLNSLNLAINYSPQSEELRILKSKCSLFSKDFDSTVADLSRAQSISKNLPINLQLRISLLSSLFLNHVEGGEVLTINPQDSLLSLKKCLNSDPDSKICSKLFKNLKSLEKDLKKLNNWLQASRWSEVVVSLAGTSTKDGLIKIVKDLIKHHQQEQEEEEDSPLPSDSIMMMNLSHESPLLKKLVSNLCRSYIELGSSSRKIQQSCQESLSFNPQDVWGLVGKSEQVQKEENWEQAVLILNEAFEKSGRTERLILEKLQKAQRLLKLSKQKDYYKILGVSRDADQKTIKRAYRKATLKAHPDKEGGSEEKMSTLNQAYEVLSNPELRARFDQGEDPNDPTNGGGGGGQGGNPFGGAGFGGNPIFFQQGGGGGFPGGSQFFAGGGGGGGQQFQFRWG
ncbi:hypothetical protein JCM3765_007345 [Sporobolomyces pararoseus]